MRNLCTWERLFRIKIFFILIYNSDPLQFNLILFLHCFFFNYTNSSDYDTSEDEEKRVESQKKGEQFRVCCILKYQVDIATL